MKEYTISGKKITFEEHFDNKKDLLNYIKDNDIRAKEVSQIFYKTYKKELGEWVEKDCVLLFCEYQNINLLNLKD